MSQRPQRVQVPPGRVQWRVVAVDTVAIPRMHAAALEDALNTLTNEGFSIVGQREVEHALIITAQRLVPVEPDAAATATFRESAPKGGVATRQVVYYFLENGILRDLTFPTMEEAVALVRTHLTAVQIVPVNVIDIQMRRYELQELTTLLSKHP